MAKKSENSPRGILEGVGKSFVGLPQSFVLNAEEQGVVANLQGNDLVRRQSRILERQGDRASHEASRALMEIQAMRSDIGDAAMALQATQWAAMQSNDHLSSISSALQDGLPAIADGIAGLQSTAEQLVGVSVTSRSIQEIVASNPSMESEAIILAMSGGLKKGQAKKLFDWLPYWKKDIVDSGLVYRHDPEMEKTLSPEEKMFLAQLRRKAESSIKTFGSIEILARHRLLDSDLHDNLSKTVAAARTGMTGLVHGVNRLEEQGATRIQQGGVLNRLQRAGLMVGVASLEEQKGIRSGVDALVDATERAQVDRRAIRASTQKTAENTYAIARGIAAQVYLAQRAEGQRDRQIEVSEGIERNTAGIQRNTELLTVFAKRGNEIAEANLGVNMETAWNTGRLVELEEVSVGFLGSIAESSEQTAQNTGRLVELEEVSVELLGSIADTSQQTAVNTASIARDTGHLVDFAERAELMRVVMIEQDQVRNMILGDMADSLDTANYYHALTREEIAGLHLTLIQGIDLARRTGVQQIIEATRTNSLLSTLIEMFKTASVEMVTTLEKIDANMERRYLTEFQARAGEKFREGHGKYTKGKIQEAIVKFNESIELWGNDHNVYFWRGICYALSDKPEEARSDFTEAFTWAVDAKDPAILAIIKMNLARLSYSESKAYAKKGNSEMSDEKKLDAILTAKEVCEIVPDFSRASFALATYLAAYKLYDDARVILMKIIPKDPKLAQEMQSVEEFGPLLGSFKHVIEEAHGKIDGTIRDRLSIAVLKDCMDFGDFSTAMFSIEELLKGGAIHLLRLKIWEIEELKPIRRQIVDVITKAMDTIGKNSDSQNCYAVTMLALLYRENQSEISNSKVFDIFLAGTQNDLDVKAQNKVAMLKKLRALSEIATGTILTINKLHRKGLEWLN